MQAISPSRPQTFGPTKLSGMADWGREPNELELRIRIRKWVQYYAKVFKAVRLKQTDLAEALGLSDPTISNLVNEHVQGGLDTLIRLHYRLQAPLEIMVHSDPPERVETPLGVPAKVLARKQA